MLLKLTTRYIKNAISHPWPTPLAPATLAKNAVALTLGFLLAWRPGRALALGKLVTLAPLPGGRP